MIKEITRSHVRAEFKGRRIVVQGEALATFLNPALGGAIFLVDSNSIQWDVAGRGGAMTSVEKAEYLMLLTEEFKRRKIVVEFE